MQIICIFLTLRCSLMLSSMFPTGRLLGPTHSLTSLSFTTSSKRTFTCTVTPKVSTFPNGWKDGIPMTWRMQLVNKSFRYLKWRVSWTLFFWQFWLVAFPLHKPYIQLILVSTSILDTWNGWWDRITPCFFSKKKQAFLEGEALEKCTKQVKGHK